MSGADDACGQDEATRETHHASPSLVGSLLGALRKSLTQIMTVRVVVRRGADVERLDRLSRPSDPGEIALRELKDRDADEVLVWVQRDSGEWSRDPCGGAWRGCS